MKYRRFGRTNFQSSEIGYGMWGLAGWTDTDAGEVALALDRAVELGCNFFDTAWGYGRGKSEQILGELVKKHPGKEFFVATKIPPKNFKWPSKPNYRFEDCFPADHIIEYTEKSLRNLGVDCIDLQQFHVWEDAWADRDEWKEAIEKLKREGKVRHFGVSINRWEPENALNTIRTGMIDAVQVIYNIFDQAPEDDLFPLCQEMEVAVIARVPFDEGTLTGTLTLASRWPEGDWRNSYFVPENLRQSVARAEALRPLVPDDMSMPELAMRWILQNETVSTVIPGMRRVKHVEENLGVSDGRTLDPALMTALKAHRWDRTPTTWSQ
jgi:aryl-alcohol dehydrogenase-like predicted oxidoreductase